MTQSIPFYILRLLLGVIAIVHVVLADPVLELADTSNLAAWTFKRVDGSLNTHVYYQSRADNWIREIVFDGSGWRKGGLAADTAPSPGFADFVPPKAGTPIGVVAPADNLIYLYYINQRNQVVEKRYANGRWSTWSVPMLDAYPGAAGLGVYRDGGGWLHVWYQDTANTIKHLFYRETDFSQRTLESPLNNVASGTSISAFMDDSNNPHIFYQSNDAKNPIIEYALWQGKWGPVVAVRHTVPNVQLASIMTGMTGGKYIDPTYEGIALGGAYSSMLFVTNDQIFNQVAWSPWECRRSWCRPVSLARVKSYKSGIAVAGHGGLIRLYYVTEKNTLGEVENVDSWDERPLPAGGGWLAYWGTSWAIKAANTDILGLIRS